MKLTFSQIQSITTGAVEIQQQSDGVRFYRFTQQQQEMLCERSNDFYRRSFGTAGIRLRFRTNSTVLKLSFSVLCAAVKSVPLPDISVDGALLEDVRDIYHEMPAPFYGDREPPYHVFSKSWDLAVGEKEICIYLPWCGAFVLDELALSDGAVIIPVLPGKKALCFGDSITHGAESSRPTKRYISRFCDYLGVAEYSKAICGEMFWPDLVNTQEPIDPDIITVAYGTNDWSKTTPEEMRENCFAFYRNIKEKYPCAKLIAITPIWRGDEFTKGREITLADVHQMICQAVEDNPNATVIRGYDLVPHDVTYFDDLRLHPGDEGFDFYYENLVKEYEKR